jgi:hypothetical protein
LAAGAQKRPSCSGAAASPQPNSSRTSRASASAGSSDAPIFPPACMKARVPRLRTSNVLPSSRTIKAAAMRIGPPLTT